MSRKRIERKLAAINERLRSLRAEAELCAAQLVQVSEEAEDARLRALVSETPLDRRDGREAQRSADTLAQRRNHVLAEIAELETRQDALLDDLVSLES